MREPEGGFLNRNFIGRDEEREKIKTRLTQDGGFLLLYGQPMVGKASLAMQVAAELREEQESIPLHVYTVDCKDAADWPGVMRAMCRAFSFDEAVANENLLVGAILRQLQEKGGGKMLLLLLRLHLLPPTGTTLDSLRRCLQSLAAADVMTLLTSRRQLQLRERERVSPLTLNDALKLLRHHAPDVTGADFEDVLRRYCYGLPPLVLQVAQMVGGESMMAYTAEELREELEQDPDLLMQGLSEEARGFFSALSPEVQGQVHALGDLLQGHFSMEALKAVMGVEGARMKTALRRLNDEAPLLINNQSQRMCIEPLVLHHVRRLGHVSDDPARLRVVNFLGQVLVRAERDLYVSGQDTVYGHLHGDWPHLQHVLKQALHCTDHTYHAYLQVAFKADKLLAKCFPNDALTFYQNMATAAVYFGTTRDQAVLQGLIGMAVTQGQAGTGWKDALQYFHRALPVLQEQPRSVSYLRLLIDLGFAYFRLNHLQESDRYLSQAVSISENIQEEEDEEVVFHMLRARNYLALPCLFRGHLQKSRSLLEDTLVLCEQLAPHHPDKPILINSLGLVFERSGTDQKMALHYYEQSLNERRRYAAIAPGDLVPVLNNVGMQYSQQGDYDTALRYLKEAADIRKRDNRWHYYTALTQQHIAQIYIQKGEYALAEEHLEEAARVYARCTPRHDVRGKVALCLAHLYVTEPLRDLSKTQKYLREVCELLEKIGDDLSDSGFVVLITAIQHRMQLDSWNNTTLHRSAQQWMSHYDGDAKQLAPHRSILEDISAMLQNGIPTEQREAVTSRVLQQCQICRYLSVTTDTRSLWRDMEQKQAAHKAAMDQLRGSQALREVLDLSGQYPPHSAPSLPGQDGRPGHLYPSSGGMAGVPLSSQSLSGESTSAAESKRQQERGGSDSGQLGQVIDRILNTAPPADKGGASSAQTQPSLPLHRPEDGTRPTQTPSWPAAAVLPQRNKNIGAFKGNVCPPEGAVMAELGLREMPAATAHRRDSDQGFSCSFTSSDPPSTSSSEAMSVSMESSDSVSSHPQQEVTTFCERVIEIFPVQETAQDQGSASSDTEQGSSGFHRRHRGGVYATDVPGEASSSGHLHSSHPAFSSPDLHLTSELNPLPSSILPTHSSSPFPPPPVQAEHSTPSSHTASPQLTLDDVVKCAQQLMAVLPSKATTEQRMMLEKLTSLTASESDSSSRALSETALHNLKSLADQAAKLSQLHSAQASEEMLQPQTVTHTPVWSPPHPGVMTDIHSQPRVHRQCSDHRGTQPFQSVHQAPSALNLTATRDQLEALDKTGRGHGHGEQNQSSQGSTIKDLDHQLRPDWGIQGGVGVASSSPHTPYTASSGDRPTALCDKALPEVRQGATSSRSSTQTTHGSSPVLATSAGPVTSRSAGTSYGMQQIGSDRKFDSGTQPEGGGNNKLYGRTQTGSEGTFYGRTSSQAGREGMFYGGTPPQTGSEGTFYGRTLSQAGSGRTVDRTQPPPSMACCPPASSISSTELFGAGRGREPTECDDNASLFHSELSAHCGQQVSPTTPRQAIENDERMDRHVCTSANCTCSWKQD